MEKQNTYSVYLRAFEEDDYKIINKWRNDPKIFVHTSSRFKYISSEMEKKWVLEKCLNNQNEEYLAVCLNDGSHRMIGYYSLREIDYVNRCIGATGIIIGDLEYRTAETMVDCNLLIFDYVFNEMGMHRLSGKALSDHYDSRTMMESLGFTYEGTQRDCLVKYGQYYSMCHYSLLDSEYRSLMEKGEYSILKIAKRASLILRKLKSSK